MTRATSSRKVTCTECDTRVSTRALDRGNRANRPQGHARVVFEHYRDGARCPGSGAIVTGRRGGPPPHHAPEGGCTRPSATN